MPHFPESFQNVVQRQNVVPGNAAVWGDQLGVLEDGGAPPGGAIAVTDGGTTVSPVTLLNFTSGATVTDAGGGEADVAISGGGSSAGPTGTLQASDGLGGFAASSVLDDGTTVAVAGENISVEAGSGILFNGASDSSGWTIGIYNRVDTVMVGKATSLQFIVDDGDKGPDGFAFGNTANTSLMELNGTGSLIVGHPTDLGKGFGSINAEFIYKNGVELLPGGGGSVGVAGVLQASDGAGGFEVTNFSDDGVGGQIKLTGGTAVLANTGNSGFFAAPDGTLTVANGAGSINLDLGAGNLNVQRALVVGTTSGPAPSDGDVDVAGSLKKNGAPIGDPGTPASAAATGTAGSILWDAGFIYVCVATDTWERVAIATW